MAQREFEKAEDLLRAKLRGIPLGKDVKTVGDIRVEADDDLLTEKNLAALTNHFDERVPWER